jgi:hypothetical protein
MRLIAASTVFIVAGTSAREHIPRRSAALPLPFDQVRYFSSAFFRSSSGMAACGVSAARCCGHSPSATNWAAKRRSAFRRLSQQQSFESFGRGFVGMIDRRDDLRLPRGIGLLVVGREHGLAETPEERRTRPPDCPPGH